MSDRCTQALVLVGLRRGIPRLTSRAPVAEVRLSSWRERGARITAGIEHKVFRQGLLGPFVSRRLVRWWRPPEKPSAFGKRSGSNPGPSLHTGATVLLATGGRALQRVPGNWLHRAEQFLRKGRSRQSAGRPVRGPAAVRRLADTAAVEARLRRCNGCRRQLTRFAAAASGSWYGC